MNVSNYSNAICGSSEAPSSVRTSGYNEGTVAPPKVLVWIMTVHFRKRT